MALAVAVAFSAAAELSPPPVAPESWPLDTYVSAKLDSVAASRKVDREHWVQMAVSSEQSILRKGEHIVVGVVLPFSEVTASDGAAWTGTDVAVEQQLVGEWPDSTITFYRPRGHFSTGWERSHTRAEDASLPEVGRRYLFVGTRFFSEPHVLRGGNRFQRYLIEDGVVVSKGIPLAEFVEHVVSLLEATDLRIESVGSQSE